MQLRTFMLTAGAALAVAVPAANATDVTTVTRPLDLQAGKYQVEIENTSGIGYVNTFKWVPPPELTITAVTSAKGGTCRLTSNAITCIGGKHRRGLAPPTCTCRRGGTMTVNFTATGARPTYNGHYWTFYGFDGDTEITEITPVQYHIPSYIPETDLPLCDPGTQPTDAHPCSVE